MFSWSVLQNGMLQKRIEGIQENKLWELLFPSNWEALFTLECFEGSHEDPDGKERVGYKRNLPFS